MKRAAWAAWLLGLCSLLGLPLAHAHESMPASLLLDQQSDGHWDVRWRLPQMQGAAPAVVPKLPAACVSMGPVRTDNLPGARLQRWTVQCSPELAAGQDLAFEGLAATAIDVVVRLAWRDGTVTSLLARPGAPQVRLGPEPASPALAASSYFALGVEHILGGIDHLLFVLCLLLLIPGKAALFKTITAFTLAHSLTLAASALGWVLVAGPPVEATIALSIVFLARELALRNAQHRLTARHPWAVAAVFGLLHGFGFAGALAEVGLPQADIPTALLLFNLGVEAGQLVFVVTVLTLLALVRRMPRPMRWRATPWLAQAPVYAVGAVAGLWFLQRLPAVVGWQWV